ncbi:MAG: ABC transporter substrate-binding protein [Clostridiales Family XIII bacterium]|jgi:ABC-type nitrate/sulfonate/bicarbonate transport system substrate-binding protein|nr:ABC transporter substrate-binding protein [Clostridiales Family XIII bacterium]
MKFHVAKNGYIVKGFAVLLLLMGLLLTQSACGKEEAQGEAAPSGETASEDASAGASETGGEEYEVLDIRFLGMPGTIWAVELAEGLGYLDPLRIDFVGNANGGPETLQALQTNNIDLGYAATNGIINIVAASDKNIVSISPLGGTDENTNAVILVLEDSSIQGARDLIGKTVGVNTFGAQNEAFIKNYLRKEGLSTEEAAQVELVVIPAGEAEQVLRSKQLDAVVISGAFKIRALDEGGVRAIANEYDVWGAMQVSLYAVTRDFAEQNPNTTRKLTSAIGQAYDWVNSTPIDEVRAKLKEIMEARAEERPGENPAVLDYWTGFGVSEPGGLIDAESLDFWLDWAVINGDIEEGLLTPEDIYTNEYNLN